MGNQFLKIFESTASVKRGAGHSSSVKFQNTPKTFSFLQKKSTLCWKMPEKTEKEKKARKRLDTPHG
jgi:hypothetical protein